MPQLPPPAPDPWWIEPLKTVINVTLGALIGLASAAWTEHRRRQKRVAEVKAAVLAELAETAHRMVVAVYKLEQNRGGITRELLEWLRPVVERYEGPNPKEGLLKGVAGLLKGNDDNLEKMRIYWEAQAQPVGIPTETVMYSAAVLSTLHELEPDFSRRVLDVLAHVRMFNEAAERSDEWQKMTFATGLSEGSQTAVRENIKKAEKDAAFRAHIIVDKIVALSLTFEPR